MIYWKLIVTDQSIKCLVPCPMRFRSPVQGDPEKNSWLVGCYWFSGPLRQYFSLNRAVSQREGERGEKG